MLPLAGITVVSVEHAVAAPFASRQLADMGARVIKIERPGCGDFAREYDTTVRGLSSHFVWLNRSKESLTLDLKRAGPEVLPRLLACADVFLHNLTPGAIERLGFGSAALRTAYPRLIVCEVSGYGSDGPYRDRKAYDLLMQSEVGLLSITGTPEAPSKTGISVADIAAGMYAFSGILTALFSRERSGAGTLLQVSLFDALAEWMGYPLNYTEYGGTPPPRTGASHATIAPYGPYAAKDGVAVYLAIQNEREWQRFCAGVLADPGLAADPRFATNANRVLHRPALDTAIAGVFGALSGDEIDSRLDAHAIGYARMNTVAEFAQHPQLRLRDRWQKVASPVGTLRALRPPIISDTLETGAGAIPALGEHTNAILGELGFSEAAIAAWRDAGAV